MKKETLNRIGIKTKKDIDANLIKLIMDDPGNGTLAKNLGLKKNDTDILSGLKSFIEEFAKEKNGANTLIKDSPAAVQAALPFFALETKETVYIATLKVNCTLVAFHKISDGDVDKVRINKRKIIQTVLNDTATKIIIFHNHPSGNPVPSAGDMSVTEDLRKALSVFEIGITDHIILGKDCFYSFSEEKTLTLHLDIAS